MVAASMVAASMAAASKEEAVFEGAEAARFVGDLRVPVVFMVDFQVRACGLDALAAFLPVDSAGLLAFLAAGSAGAQYQDHDLSGRRDLRPGALPGQQEALLSRVDSSLRVRLRAEAVRLAV
jgi:hypothetical protein